jgi:hypothetical protein
MGGLKVNFAEIEGSFDPLPEGRYDVEVERIEVRESKSSEHDYFNWEFNVLHEDHEGRKLWMITSLSPKAMFRLKDTLVALEVIDEDDELDFEWEDDVDITPGEGPLLTNPDLQEMTGIVAVVTNEVYEGKERNRVSDVYLGDADEEPAAKEEEKEEKKGTAKKGKAKKGKSKRKRKLR